MLFKMYQSCFSTRFRRIYKQVDRKWMTISLVDDSVQDRAEEPSIATSIRSFLAISIASFKEWTI